MMEKKSRSTKDALAQLSPPVLKSFAHEVSLLYSATQGASFVAVLRRFVTGLVPFDDLTIFCQQDADHPQLIWSSFEPDVIRTGVRNYVDATYVVDPFISAFREGAPAGAYRAIDVAKDAGLSRRDEHALPLQIHEAEELGYVTDDWPKNCGELQIVFPLSLKRKDDICCQIGLYRSPGQATFSESEAALLTSLTPLIAAAFSQYWERLAGPKAATIEPACLQLLSARERTVIELVLQGFTSAAVAVLLQVSLETVKTHRKRAYRKLEISSQAELFAMMQSAPSAIKYHA